MKVIIKENKNELGKIAAFTGAEKIREALRIKGDANIILATGASQFEMLEWLVQEKMDWSKVTCFHLDEYIGLNELHPASFRKYLKERFSSKIETAEFYYVNGEGDPVEECERLDLIIENYPIDVAFIGIGENGHLAFNDPPADFETEKPYIIVNLDEMCRKQQYGEGWFNNLHEVPSRAISMSINQIMKSKTIICTVPDKRKAIAVKITMEGEISPSVPASILKKHGDTFLFLDEESSSLLNRP